ncbi:TIGR03086 family metal-binding protein [Arthrobacter sp. JSM 101049]|uniref:TIGR03086 family metal-binding protein n=1 Tax=Arthrobacter sp. JSM 101049 TaxID=929097 RepID=UPI003561924F
MPASPQSPSIEPLARALECVGEVISGIGSGQWTAPTPCTEWSVRDVVAHLVGMNLVFAAMLGNEAPPDRAVDPLGTDPAAAYASSAAKLQGTFGEPGVLDRVYSSPLGDATGAERMQIRLYDLMAHGWDLAQATGQPFNVPDDLAGPSLEFARSQLASQQRSGRFAPVQPVPDDAPAILRLVAFLGRPVREHGPA